MVVNTAGEQYEDITGLWMEAHPHLKPMPEYIEQSSVDYHQCPSCRAKSAVDIAADVQLKSGLWLKHAKVLFCASCEHVFLSDSNKIQNMDSPLPGNDYYVTKVNARLWVQSPTFLNIEPTTRCNFDCWYCVGRSMTQGDIKESDFARMLDNYPDLKVLALVGEGEPFLHKGFFEMSRMAMAKGIKIATTTNGSTLSSSMVKKICETGIHYISVSIDSVNSEQFAATRIKGDLDKVLNGIRRLKKYRDDNGYQYPVIGLKGTLFDYSSDQLPEITKKAISCGADVMEGFQPLNRKESYAKIYPQEHLHQLNSIDQVAQNISSSISEVLASEEYDIMGLQDYSNLENMDLIDSGTGNGIRKNCDERWLYSLFSGDVTPCCQIKEPFSEQWNLFNNKVEQILTNPAYENIRFNLWNGFFLPQCKGCYKT